MLEHLHIRHFAIIDETEVELGTGMTALTGETGAGKSILLDALGMVTGERASIDNIQQGQERAEVTASFDTDNLKSVNEWLKQNDLDDNDSCVLRRIINRKGKTRSSINGTPVSLQTLKTLGQQLLSIHGQNQHQQLTSAADQRALLDQFTQSPLIKQVAESYDAWQAAQAKLEEHQQSAQARQHRLDLVQFQLQEFDALDSGGVSHSDIEAEHRWLANAERLIQLGETACTALSSNESSNSTANTAADEQVANAIVALNELVNIDERVQEALDLVESAHIQISEASMLVRNHISAMEHDGNRLQWLDERLSVLHKLSKKHLVELSELDAVEQTLRDEYDLLSSPAMQPDALQAEADALKLVYQAQAVKLSKLRQRTAKKLSKTITESMQQLAMEGGVFEITVTADKTAYSRHGQDHIVFNVSPNPGVNPAPLSKVASGGELSRISLCIQLAVIDTQPVQTLIFDEVDAGIGGAVAQTVGHRLRQVGNVAQVLCVTHLPQVASQAHQHLLVSKQVVKGKTSTALTTLTKKQTEDEIARMLGGAKLTKKSRQHAKEMLESAGTA